LLLCENGRLETVCGYDTLHSKLHHSVTVNRGWTFIRAACICSSMEFSVHVLVAVLRLKRMFAFLSSCRLRVTTTQGMRLWLTTHTCVSCRKKQNKC
jgi:hypothetical protein